MYDAIYGILPFSFSGVMLLRLNKGSVETKSGPACPIMNRGIDGWISALKRQGNKMDEQLQFEEGKRGERNLSTDPCSCLGSIQEDDYITTLIVITFLIFPTVKQDVQSHK